MGEEMKVLYINAMGPKEKSPQRGIFVSQRIKALKKMGVDVVPCSLDIEYSKIAKKILKVISKFPDFGDPLQDQIRVKYDVIKVRYNLFEIALSKCYPDVFSKKIFQKLQNLVEIEMPDLIHLHWLWPAGIGIEKIARKYNIPYIVTCHGSEINYSLKSKFLKKPILKIMENARAVEFISKALKQEAISAGYSGKNAVVVYNGIDTEIFKRNSFEIHKERKRIGFVGNLIPVKGADRLSNIFKKIYENVGEKIDFVIIGQGTLKEELERKLKTVPVRFAGVLTPEQLAKEYQYMDILIVPSRKEGYSCVIKEAQACGVIPIGNNVGGVKEAIGNYGILVSGNSEEELDEAFVKAVNDIITQQTIVNRERMIESAAQCSWNERQKKSVNIYKNIKK